MNSRVYLDYNATTPLHPMLHEFVLKNMNVFGNPSSVHAPGREAKKLITQARNQIAQSLKANPFEIIFTATGSEANNFAIQKALPLVPTMRNEILISSVEHPSVVKAAESLKERGYKITSIPVLKTGKLDLAFFKTQLSSKTALVSIQFVNNETGNIFPIKELCALTHQVGALFHSDMVQALGKIEIDFKDLDVDFATIAGHKFYSLKGAAFLYAKQGTHLTSLIHGGGQERGRRAGTENTLAISCLGEAMRLILPTMNLEIARVRKLRDYLETEILKLDPGFKINGSESERVYNVINVTCSGFEGETLLINLDVKGCSVSSGAACSSGTQEPSPVLRAMGLSLTEARQSLRITLGYLTTDEDINIFLSAFKASLNHMRLTSSEVVNI